MNDFECVYTVNDWYDGPVRGFADHGGKPHAYVRILDMDPDAFSPIFELWPIDAETLRWAREQWTLWERWSEAFYRGATDTSTHPALPEDRARHEELQRLLGDPWVRPPGTQPLYARADFKAPAQGEEGELRVRWTAAEPVDR